MYCVEFDNVNFSYENNQILKDFSFKVPTGSVEAIVGPSGLGKSTILSLILGRLRAESGEIKRNFTTPGIVYQNDSLIENITVISNIKYICTDAARAESALEMVGLSRVAKLRTEGLSKGMKKRVEIARAVSVQPDLFVMDEPFSNLDHFTKVNIIAQLKYLTGELNSTFIYVSHDIDEALSMCGSINVFADKPLKSFKRFENSDNTDKKELKDKILSEMNG